MTALERGFAIKVARIIDKASRDAAQAVVEYGSSALIDAALADMGTSLSMAFAEQYSRTIRLFGDRILKAFKGHAKYNTKADDLFTQEVERWMLTTTADRVVMIEDTTKAQIRKAISDGFGASLTGQQVALSIVEKTGGVIAKNRGIVISRTETHMAANFASQQAAESTGIPMKRVWIAAEDDRTRETHSGADSASHAEPVAMKETFPVVNLEYPGDPGGDPAETINCRCAVGYVTE